MTSLARLPHELFVGPPLLTLESLVRARARARRLAPRGHVIVGIQSSTRFPPASGNERNLIVRRAEVLYPPRIFRRTGRRGR